MVFQRALDEYEKSVQPEKPFPAYLGAFVDGVFRFVVPTNPALAYVRHLDDTPTTAKHRNRVDLSKDPTVADNQDILIALYYDEYKELAIWGLDPREAGAVLEGDPSAGAGGVKSVTGSAVNNADPVNPVINLPSGTFPVFGAGVIKTLASDVASAGTDRHLIIAAQTGTADNLIEITGLNVGDEVIIRADAGDTITVKNNDAGATDKIFLYNGADLALSGNRTLKLNKIASGIVVQYVDEKGAGGSDEYILFQDQKTLGTAGGTFTSAAWRTRDLNTEVADTGGYASLSSNQIILAAGTYIVRATAPAYHCELHQTRLQNITDGSTIQYGGSAYANATSNVMNNSELMGYFTIAATKTLELQHRCSQTKSTDGFGTNNSQGTEVYAQIEFWKRS